MTKHELLQAINFRTIDAPKDAIIAALEQWA